MLAQAKNERRSVCDLTPYQILELRQSERKPRIKSGIDRKKKKKMKENITVTKRKKEIEKDYERDYREQKERKVGIKKWWVFVSV